MKLASLTAASALALSLAGCGHKQESSAVSAENGSAPQASYNDVAMTAPSISAGQRFANDAAASDAFEISTSKLALTKSSSASIKKFAQMMIDAHTESTAKLKAAAAGATPAITPDPSLTADQTAELESLKASSGEAFDVAYKAAQTEGHQMTLDKLRAYATAGDVPELKVFAGKLVPIVTAHLNMAKSLKS